MTVEERRKGPRKGLGDLQSSSSALLPAAPTLGGPEFHMSPHSHSVRALKRRERAVREGGGQFALNP